MNEKKSLSICIPAFNEEVNLQNLLNSLLQQKIPSFSLKEIAIYSDGSTDKTNDIVNSFHKRHPLIKLVHDGKRKGKYARVNEIFRDCKSDVLIMVDADIAFVGNDFMEKLATALMADPKAQMVAAHNVLLRPSSFIGKVLHANFVWWDFVRLSVPGYDTAANFYGTATAYRGTFARSLTIPASVSDGHLYIYLAAKKLNGFRYCREAEVLQWPLSTMEDFDKFFNRSLGKDDPTIEKIFGVKRDDVYQFPLRYKFLGLWKTFCWDPLYAFFAVLFVIYITKLRRPNKKKNAIIWDITTSSKKPITYAKK